VAPRAKQNQQRSRRYRAAKERKEIDSLEENLRNDLIEKGLIPPPKKSTWDSNVITPGTKFMDKVTIGLRYYISNRMANDPSWKNLKVVISDASVPGEGEHKIMNFIRSQRSQPGYDPNTKHVLHGLDADLIMLALGTHEYYFYILREQVFMGSSSDQQLRNPNLSEYEREPYEFLWIPVFREYLEKEFSGLERELPFKFEIERIVDDFIFMCFFVGNDFLPHLPTLEIRDGAIDLLFNLYRKTLPRMGDYITYRGDVNIQRAQMLLEQLGNVEDRVLKNKLLEERKREARFKRRDVEDKEREAILNDPSQVVALGGNHENLKRKRDVVEESIDENKKAADDLRNLLKQKKQTPEEPSAKRQRTSYEDKNPDTVSHALVSEEQLVQTSIPSPTAQEPTDGLVFDDEDEVVAKPVLPREMSEDEAKKHKTNISKALNVMNTVDENLHPDLVKLGEEGWKQRYYKTKFNIEPDPALEEYQQISREYLRGLVWVYRYYFLGCASWNWFFPYHYAPFASDLAVATNVDTTFNLSTPYQPFLQLLSVLPPDSAHALPTKYADLMTDKYSLMKEFYPDDFKVDLNGKKKAWQGVTLLPFIEEDKLLSTVADLDLEQSLTEEEQIRNSTGKDLLGVHDSSDLSMQLLPLYMEKKKQIQLDMTRDQIAGTVEPSRFNNEPGATVELPWPSKEMEPVQNVVICADYTLPKGGELIFGLLPGLERPDPMLPQLEQQYGEGGARQNRTLMQLFRDIENDQQGGSHNRYHRSDSNRPNYRDNRDNRSDYRGRDNSSDNRQQYGDNRGGYRSNNRDYSQRDYRSSNSADRRDNRDNRDNRRDYNRGSDSNRSRDYSDNRSRQYNNNDRSNSNNNYSSNRRPAPDNTYNQANRTYQPTIQQQPQQQYQLYQQQPQLQQPPQQTYGQPYGSYPQPLLQNQQQPPMNTYQQQQQIHPQQQQQQYAYYPVMQNQLNTFQQQQQQPQQQEFPFFQQQQQQPHHDVNDHDTSKYLQ
jgi:5'-3' exoribonuclease 2